MKEKTKLLDVKIELFGHLKQLGHEPKKINKSADKLEFEEIILLNKVVNDVENDIERKTRTVKYFLTSAQKGVELDIRCEDCVMGEEIKERFDPVCKNFVIEKNNLEMVMELWKSIVQYLKEVVYNFGEWIETAYQNKSEETIASVPVLTTHTGEIFELNKPIPPRLENKQKSRPLILNRRRPTKRKSD